MLVMLLLLVTIHFFFFLIYFLLGLMFSREYVNAAKVLDIGKYSAINVDEDLHSIRYYQDYVLYGSNRHRLTSQIDFGKHYERVEKSLNSIW